MAASISPYAETELVPVDDFHLIGLLGEGGNGTVYAARHKGCDVALKVLREGLALSDRERNRFLDEAVRMRRVEHEGLVPLLGSGVLSDGRPYLCMPRLRGETLASRLDRGALPLAFAIATFDALAQAVAVLHRAGLIHRDIKPENVFLEDPGVGEAGAQPRPVLLDFGIARDVTDDASTTTAAGLTRGTPAYMAPERFFGAVANVRTDVYELAVTLYAMLTGRLPWDSVQSAQSAASRLSPRHPGDAGVALPPELVTVILRALSTRPEMRPESADSFADQVRRAAASAPPDSPRTTAVMTAVARTAPGSPGGDAAEALGGATPGPLTRDAEATGRVRRNVRRGLVLTVSAALFVFAAAELLHPGQDASPATVTRAAEPPPSPVAWQAPVVPGAPPVAQAVTQTVAQAGAQTGAQPVTQTVAQAVATPTAAPAPTSSASPRRSPPPLVMSAAPAASSAPSPDRYYRDRK